MILNGRASQKKLQKTATGPSPPKQERAGCITIVMALTHHEAVQS